MHRILPVAVSLLALSAPALAQDRTAALDLVAKFVLGVEQGAILGMAAENPNGATAVESAPGKFSIDVGNGLTIKFDVTEKSNCVFDIGFSQNDAFGGGIELNAGLLKSVAYSKINAAGAVTQYGITLEGGEGLVQYLGPDGTLTPAAPTSTLNTSLTDTQMLEAAARFQAEFCPAVA